MNKKNDEVIWCSNCLNVSTRPRITFDANGKCNACVWSEKKKSFNWAQKKVELVNLLNDMKSTSYGYDCIVPVSGGKDGSYVSHQLKKNFGVNPLTVTVRPALEIEIGNKIEVNN